MPLLENEHQPNFWLFIQQRQQTLLKTAFLLMLVWPTLTSNAANLESREKSIFHDTQQFNNRQTVAAFLPSILYLLEPESEPNIDQENVCESWSRTFPDNAYTVTPDDKLKLQQLLDAHRTLRLAPGDYRTNGLNKLTIKSNQTIVALSPQKFPNIEVSAGTKNARVEGLQGLTISFQSGQPISHNCFTNLGLARIEVQDAAVERNVFLRLSNVSLSVDTSTRGHFSNNRFIKLNSHASALPIEIKGDTSRTSRGNVFLLLDAQTPLGSGFSISDQNDISFVGVDLESYNQREQEDAPYAFKVRNTGVFTAVHGSGMNRKGNETSPAFDIDAEQIFMHRLSAPSPQPTLRVGPLNNRLFSWRNRLTLADTDNDASNNALFFAQENRNGGLLHDVAMLSRETRLSQPLTGSLSDSLSNAIVPLKEVQPWKIPDFPAVPDPVGPNWSSELETRVDESAAIQALINEHGIAYLEPRTYYIGSPIVLDKEQGIVGAGASKTAIVSLSPEIDMIQLDWSGLEECRAITKGFTLADITLQGGRNGVRSNTPGTQINRAVISHVTFRNMSNAGILIDGAYGWDNNVLSYVNFVDSAFGFLQLGQPRPTESCYAINEWATMSYVDKTVFYRNQFLRLGHAMVLEPTRANNLDGIVESLFKDSTQSALTIGAGNNAFLIASSRFVNNAGDPVVRGNTAMVNSHFEAGQGTSLLSAGITVEGSTFSSGGSTSATVFGPTSFGDVRNPRFFDIYNSRLNVPLGPVTSTLPVAGLFFNNQTLEQDDPENFLKVIEYTTQGTPPTTDDTRTVIPLLNGTSQPGSKLLYSH